jgi:pimeloyl-ACP methyl ester carboxylesterase
MTTVLLLPGLLCDDWTWAHQVTALAPIARTRVPLFRGLASLGAMAERAMDEAPERVVVVGHSMGARVAFEIWRRWPERVLGLGLLDTGAHPRRAGETEKRMALVELARTRGMAAMAAEWIPPMVHPDRLSDNTLMDPLTAMICRSTPDDFAGQQRALLDRPDAEPLLATITCPTLVACGRHDAWAPVAQHEAIAAAVPGARLAVVEEAGHMLPVERPDDLNRLLIDWLSDIRRD